MEFLEYNKREIQTHLLSLIFVSSLKLYYKEMLFVFFILLKIKKVVNWCLNIYLETRAKSAEQSLYLILNS